jgi:hypothetical protein
MQPTVKTVPNKNMYVNEAFQAKIDELRNHLVANGVDLRDHTGVVRDVVLFRWLVEQERIRQGLDEQKPTR